MARPREVYRAREAATARYGSEVGGLAAEYELRRVVRVGASEEASRGFPVRTPQQALPTFRALLDVRAIESFVALYLDVRHRAIGSVELARGSVNMVHLVPRELLQVGLVFGAAACIIAHNHPTGDATPSEDDVALTKRLQAAGALVGVEVIDHLIVGEAAYYSFTSGRIFREVAATGPEGAAVLQPLLPQAPARTATTHSPAGSSLGDTADTAATDGRES